MDDPPKMKDLHEAKIGFNLKGRPSEEVIAEGRQADMYRLDDYRPTVWSCICGSVDFWLYRDGRVECASCKLVSNEAKCFFEEHDRG